MLMIVNDEDVTVCDRNVQVGIEKVMIWGDGDDGRES